MKNRIGAMKLQEYTFVPNHMAILFPVFSDTVVTEEKTELIVPDSQPDVLRILRTDGCVCLQSKDSAEGSVTVGGMAEVTVIYVPEGTVGVRKLEATLPFSVSMQGEKIRPDSLITAKVKLTGIETKMVNPRKVMLRMTVSVFSACWNEETLEIPARLRDDDPSAEFLQSAVECRIPAEVTEKTFMLSDEISVPSLQSRAAEVISGSVSFSDESFSQMGERLIVKGEASLELLIRNEEGALECSTYSLPFSQLLEFSEPCENDVFDVDVSLTGVYVTPDHSETGTVDIELHAVLQCVLYQTVTLSCLSDGYCLDGELSMEWADWEWKHFIGAETLTGEWNGKVKTTAAPSEILSVSCLFGSAFHGSEEGTLQSHGEVTVVYVAEDGRTLSAVQRINVSTPYNLQAGENVRPELFCAGEIRAQISDGEVSLRLPYSWKMKRYSVFTVRAIRKAGREPLDSTPVRTPSVVLRRHAAEETMWSYAKRYRSTVSMIREANRLGDDEDPEVGCLLIIPRKRL